MPRFGPPLVLAILLPWVALAPRLVVDNSIEALLASDDDKAAAYRSFQAELGSDEPIVVELSGGEALALLKRAVALEATLGEAPTVHRIFGPTSLYPEEVTVLTDPVLGDAEALQAATPAFAGPLGRTLHVFQPGRPAALIYAFLSPGPASARRPLLDRLEAFRTEAEAEGYQVRIAGPPVLNLALDRAGQSVERVALPILAVVQLLMMLFFTRSARATACLFVSIGLVLVASDGLLVALGETSNIVVNIAKPLLLVLLLSSGVYLVEGYFEALAEAPPLEAARRARRQLLAPTAVSLVTTIVGFGSLLLSPISPIRVFGLVSGLGLLLGAPVLLILLPALLARFVPQRRQQQGPGLERWALRAVAWAARHPGPVVAVGLLLTALGPVALAQLRTEPHALRYFAPDHPVRRDAEALEQSGVGLSTIELVVTATHSLTQDPGSVRALDALSQSLGQLPGVRGVVGLPLFLREVGFRSLGQDQLPGPLVVEKVLEAERDRLDFVLSRADHRARLSLLIETLDADQIDRLAEEAQQRFAAHFGPGTTLTMTGSYALLLEAQRGLLQTLHASLLSSGLLMGLILLVALRSFKLGLVALLPNLFPVSLLFMTMVALDLPLDLGTSMCAAITLGIAVDNTIHYIDSWRSLGLEGAARGTGGPVIITSLVVSAGFFALVSSDFAPTRSFGLLMTLAMFYALLADLFQLPALLTLIPLPGRPPSVSDRR